MSTIAGRAHPRRSSRWLHVAAILTACTAIACTPSADPTASVPAVTAGPLQTATAEPTAAAHESAATNVGATPAPAPTAGPLQTSPPEPTAGAATPTASPTRTATPQPSAWAPTSVAFSGLPPADQGLAVLLGSSYGQQRLALVGGTASTGLHAGERVIALQGSSAVTATATASGTTVRLRSLADGASASVKVDRHVDFAAVIRAGVLLAANDLSRAGRDMGMMLWDPKAGTVSDVVPPAKASGADVVRGVLLSPSGKLAASQLVPFSGGSCVVTLIDGATGRKIGTRTLHAESTSMTEDTFLVRHGADLEGVDIASGTVLWTRSGEFHLGYATAGAFIVSSDVTGTSPQTYRLLAIDARSGSTRLLYSHRINSSWTLWLGLSTASTAVASPAGGFEEATSQPGTVTAVAIPTRGGKAVPVQMVVR